MGAGPAGLTLALALGKVGYDIVVLEKRPHPELTSSSGFRAWGTRQRNVTIDARTAATIKDLGVFLSAKEFSYLEINTPSISNYFLNQVPLNSVFEIIFNRNLYHIGTIDKIEQELMEIIRNHGKIDVIFEANDVRLQNLENVVTAQFRTIDRQHTIHGKLAFNASVLNNNVAPSLPGKLLNIESTSGLDYICANFTSSSNDTYVTYTFDPDYRFPVITSFTSKAVTAVFIEVS